MSEVPVNLLKPHPKNAELFPEKLPDELWQKLVEDIRENGILNPLIVAPDYTVLAGHLRLEAAKEAGLTRVPVVIRDIDPESEEAVSLLIRDNLLRRQLSDMQVARLIRKLKELRGVRRGGDRRSDEAKSNGKVCRLIEAESKSQFETLKIAQMLGMSKATLHRLDKLNDLIPDLQALLELGKWDATSVAAIVASLPPDEQEKLLSYLGESGICNLSVKQAQELKKELEAERKKKEDLLRLVSSLEEEKNRILQEAQQKEKRTRETELKLKELEKQLAFLRERLQQAQNNVVTKVVEKVVYRTDPELEKKLAEQEQKLKAREEELKALKEKLERAKLKRAELEKQVEDLGNALAARSEAKLPISDLNRFRIAVREAARTIGERLADVRVCFAPSIQNHREALDLLEKLVAHLEGELGELKELLGRARRTGKVIDLGTHKAH
ncbi:ParB/RepB/Spo0J family partition protein [Ammonifex thiophilus]|uniref:ParB/RepB/Spo0J family partition protein n=1 Tax=Ammonifex thiophilus TaxID=444093 RepID=UPI001402C565|nr:ParB N-terminal domain-containing protein [Ammonifex thiophilus]